MQFGAESRKDWFKMGGEVLFDSPHWGLDGCIDGGNIGTKLFNFFLGLNETRLQGVEASFQVLATGIGHEDGGTKKEQAGSKILPKNAMDECDKGKEMNPME